MGAFEGIGLVPVETSFVLFSGEAGGPDSMTTLSSEGEIVRRDVIDVPVLLCVNGGVERDAVPPRRRCDGDPPGSRRQLCPALCINAH